MSYLPVSPAAVFSAQISTNFCEIPTQAAGRTVPDPAQQIQQTSIDSNGHEASESRPTKRVSTTDNTSEARPAKRARTTGDSSYLRCPPVGPNTAGLNGNSSQNNAVFSNRVSAKFPKIAAQDANRKGSSVIDNHSGGEAGLNTNDNTKFHDSIQGHQHDIETHGPTECGKQGNSEPPFLSLGVDLLPSYDNLDDGSIVYGNDEASTFDWGQDPIQDHYDALQSIDLFLVSQQNGSSSATNSESIMNPYNLDQPTAHPAIKAQGNSSVPAPSSSSDSSTVPSQQSQGQHAEDDDADSLFGSEPDV
jgi:hypothetical protein